MDRETGSTPFQEANTVGAERAQEGSGSEKTMGRQSASATCWSKQDALLLCVLVILGFTLRFAGMGYGLPSVFHPDETRQVLDALSMGQRLSPLPVDHTYPALHKYFLLVAYGGYYAVGMLLGWFHGPSDFAVHYFVDSSPFFWLGRLLSVVAGTGLGVVLFFVGRRLYTTATGWAAILFGMCMIHLVGHSQWALPDIFLAVACTVTLHYLFQYLDSPQVSNSVLASLWAGAAISIKYHGLFLLFPLLLTHVWVAVRDRSARSVVKPAAWGALALMASSLAGNLAWLFQYREIHQKFSELSQIGVLGISSRATYRPGMLSISIWFARELVRQELLLGAMLVAGILYAIYRHTVRDLLILSFLAVTLFALSGWGIRYLHLLVATFGVLCLLAARLCADLASRVPSAWRKWVMAFSCLAIISGSVVRVARLDSARSEPDTREIAVAWVTTHIPAGTRIAVDWFELGPQLPGAAPVAVSNPRATDYWENHIDASLKNAYFERVRDRTTYPLLSAMYATDQPHWPKEMPAAVVEKALRYPAIRHLYSRFNFYSLKQLKQQGAQYLVISSFAYCHFLLDDDARKTGLFDPSGIEDTLANNKQAASYQEDSFHGLLFYLVKNAREFYLPLLAGAKGSDFEQVYEVRPDGKNWGPIVKIFRLL
ncbi:MAG: glycosyltransferase family 39 protein [Acidobacteria bacterium]|nr:glycosyltransferase family 39 protein [Acidobacteriota bacterium]